MGSNQEKHHLPRGIHHEDSTIGLLMSFWGLPSPTILNEAELNCEKAKESETQALADFMLGAQETSDLKGPIPRLEAMLKVEAATSNDYWNKL